MNEPLASVLLPFRDAEHTLAEAIASVLAWDGPLEVLAVDDGSRDGGPAFVLERARTDARLRLVANRGRGLVAALRTAAAEARGRVFVRMDADDVSHQARIPAQLARLAGSPSIGALGTRVEVLAESPPAEGWRRYVAWQNGLLTEDDHDRDLFVESPLCHPSVAIPRAVYESVGGYREGAFPEDYDLFLRIAARGLGLAKLETPLLRWRHHGGQTTFRDPRYAPEAFRLLKAHHLAPRLAAETRPILVWGAGQEGRRMARALMAEGVPVEGFVDIDPRKIGRSLHRRPIRAMEALPRPDEVYVVVAVAARGARELVRAHLAGRGFEEPRDYRSVA